MPIVDYFCPSYAHSFLLQLSVAERLGVPHRDGGGRWRDTHAAVNVNAGRTCCLSVATHTLRPNKSSENSRVECRSLSYMGPLRPFGFIAVEDDDESMMALTPFGSVRPVQRRRRKSHTTDEGEIAHRTSNHRRCPSSCTLGGGPTLALHSQQGVFAVGDPSTAVSCFRRNFQVTVAHSLRNSSSLFGDENGLHAASLPMRERERERVS